MTCQNCNANIPEGSVFCPNCGSKVTVPQPEAAPASAFCSNCGERLAPGSAFCTNCGASQSAAASGGAKKPAGSGKKAPVGLIGGIAGGVVVIALALILIFTGAFQSASGTFRTIMEKALVDTVVSALDTADSKASAVEFSTDMTIGLELGADSEVAEYLDDASITVKVDADKKSVLSEVGVRFGGSDILSATVTYADGVAGFYLPDLDKEYYTFNIEEFISNLSGEDVSLGLNDEQPTLDTKKVAALWQRYADIVLDIINKDNVSVEKKQTVELGTLKEEVENCTVYTFEPSEEDIEAMLLALSEELKSDKELEEFLADPALVEFMALFMYGEPLSVSGMDADEITDEILDEIEYLADELEDSAADIAEMVVDSDFCIRAAIKGTDLVELAIRADGDEELRLEVFGSEKDGLTYCFASADDDEVYGFAKLYYEVNGDIALGEFSVDSWGEDVFSLRFEADTKSKSALGLYHGEYRLYYEEFDTPIYLTVEKTDNGTKHTIGVKDLSELDYYLDDASYYLGDEIAVVITTTDKASTAAAPDRDAKDITDYTEDELYDIVSAWEDELSTLFSDILY